MTTRLDIVIFGATGFTGKREILELAKIIQSEGCSLTWGIAGRSKEKLRDALLEVGRKTGSNYDAVPIIVADVSDDVSLRKMTSQVRVVINTVGPFSVYGEPVIKACIETSTNYVDVSAEPQFNEAMHVKYHGAAAEKGIYVISACGVDCIPCDLGVTYLQNNFNGVLNTVEAYGELIPGKGSGPTGNYATWDSIIRTAPHLKEVYDTYPKLYRHNIPDFKPKLSKRGLLHRSNVVNKWAFPLLCADEFVVMRSQKFFYEHNKQRPVPIQIYGCINSFCALLKLLVFGIVLFLCVPFEFTRNLLLKHPNFFSGGFFSHGGPSEEKQEQTEFRMTLVGNGWKEKVSDPDDEYNSPPNRTVIARVSGRNPGYGFSSVTLALSAVTILEERSKMPERGGVLSPGAAYARTSIIEKLCRYGIKFEMLTK